MLVAILVLGFGVYQYDKNFTVEVPDIKEEKCIECDKILEEL